MKTSPPGTATGVSDSDATSVLTVFQPHDIEKMLRLGIGCLVVNDPLNFLQLDHC